MRISCILTADEIGEDRSGVVVFPESVSPSTLIGATRVAPNATIVGAIEEHGFGRGVLISGGHNRIDYRKIETDGHGRIRGTGRIPRMPVYEFPHLCIGVFICMDVDCNDFSLAVLARIRLSKAALKIVCIPANMGSFWFSNEQLDRRFEGIHVALCNNATTYQGPSRCKSFISNTCLQKVVIQRDREAISHDPDDGDRMVGE